MKISNLAVAVSLALGATAMVAAPADAQRRQRQQQQEGPTLTAEEGAAMRPAITAVQAQDWAAAQAALPAAQAGATTPYGRFVAGQLTFQVGTSTQNLQLQSQGVDAMLASGGAPAANMAALLGAQANFAIQGNDFAKAEQALVRLIELTPNDVERLRQLAEVKIRLSKNAEALPIYQRILQLSEASGQNAPEDYYRRTLALAREARQDQLATEIMQKLLRAYPNQENWRTALTLYRQATMSNEAMALDVRRLMLAAGALARAPDYIEFADRLGRAGLPGEQKAVLEEGRRSGAIPASDTLATQMIASANERIAEDRPTLARSRTQALAGTARQARAMGDAYYAYGQYAEAVELYRAALQKGGEDPNVINTRLGAALARAGQRAEAEAAFRTVTSGPYADLANYWVLWLSRPAA